MAKNPERNSLRTYPYGRPRHNKKATLSRNLHLKQEREISHFFTKKA